jgi:uroporphyrinogen decarboxylase
MPATMTPRERVLCALYHDEPDRVPTALFGSYYSLQDGTYFRLLQHLGIKEPVPPFRRFKTRSTNYYDDRVLDLLGTDTRYVWLGFTDLGGANPDTLTDAWGVHYRMRGQYISAHRYPLGEATIEDVERHRWPDPEQYIDRELCTGRGKTLKKEGKYAVVARGVNSYGPFEQASELRGRDKFLMDLVLDPELATLMLTKVTDVIVRLIEILLDTCGNDIDIIELPGDDYGATEALLISPEMYRKFMRPQLERIIRPVKEFRDDLFVSFHSDGAVADILNDFIDSGIDLFHPLEPLPANNMSRIKKRFGDRLAFMGAIDIKKAMTGSGEDVEEEVQRRIGILAPGGGYILAPANHLQTDVPPENIVALFESCRKHGVYPLG